MICNFQLSSQSTPLVLLLCTQFIALHVFVSRLDCQPLWERAWLLYWSLRLFQCPAEFWGCGPVLIYRVAIWVLLLGVYCLEDFLYSGSYCGSVIFVQFHQGRLNPGPTWLSCPHVPLVARSREDKVYEGGLKQSHPHCWRSGPGWVPSREGVSCEDKHISLDYVHPRLVISPHRLSSRILAGFTRFGHGMTEGALVLAGI